MIFMLIYIPFLLPGTWVLDRFGLRTTLLLGVRLNCLGAWLKCLAVELSQPVDVETKSAMSSFCVLFVAQSICATAPVFILRVPAHLASVWFVENEQSLATSIGVFGIQCLLQAAWVWK